jgi:hypothetical protein
MPKPGTLISCLYLPVAAVYAHFLLLTLDVILSHCH